MVVSVVTGYELCTVAGSSKESNIQNLYSGKGITSSAIKSWTKIENANYESSNEILNLLKECACNCLNMAGFIENKVVTSDWLNAKKSLVIGSNFWETNLWEEQRKDKSYLWDYNWSSHELAKYLDINSAIINVSTACSSSASAIVAACQLIEAGDSDVVLIGGYDLNTATPENGMKTIGALAKEKIAPFDLNRTGTDIADGVGFMIIESSDFAAKRNAKIYAKICGYGISNDAYNITAPNPEGLALETAMRQALIMSRLEPNKIQYINAHGSGTPLNDKLETKVIKKVFGEHANNLYINSSKSIIGHTLGAGGIIESIITIMQLLNNRLHPTANYSVYDPECDLNYCTQGTIYGNFNYALSNSIGFGGINVSIVYEKGEKVEK